MRPQAVKVFSVVLAGTFAVATPAKAAIDQPLADWQMNEPAGTRTMVNGLGTGMNGAIGANVLVGTALSGGGTGYRFPYLRPNTPPPTPSMSCGCRTTAG